MQKRKSHTKSRNGCLNCKKRRVKCDETGPPCGNCAARPWELTACSYPGHQPLPIRRPKPQRLSLCSISSPSPLTLSSTASTNRLLELELLHRWTTHSWTSFSAIPECHAYLTSHLPRQALSNPYLLHAIFSAAATDLALNTTSPHYLHAALTQSTLATTAFRNTITHTTPDNIDLLMYFSSLTAIVSFSTPLPGTHIIDRVLTYVEMILSSIRMAAGHIDWLLASPCPAQAAVRDYAVDLSLLDILDLETKRAIGLMNDVSKMVTVGGTPAIDIWAYKLAVGQTKYCFAETRLKNYYVNLWTVAGMEFVEQVRRQEPVALFVVLFWGVLVDRAAKEPGDWICGRSGVEIVEVVSQMLLKGEIGGMKEVREGIAWTRREVALEALEGCVWEGSGVVGEV
ncbi:hypothetical protein OQA88_8986 [Cercophora sp. LCS_1]